jgi:TRAP transporter TAXI family solute receptor
MAKSVKGGWRVNRLAVGVWLFGAAVLVLGLILALQFVGPAPPRQVVLATGADGGAYQSYGEKLKVYLEMQGVDVELRETAGAVENIGLLQADSGVDVAFVQGGLVADTAPQGIVALGSLYLEPVWVFVRSDIEIEAVADLLGKRLSVGAEGSGTRVVIKRFLAANDIDADNAVLLDVAADALPDAFAANEIDAAFLIGGAESEIVTGLVALENVMLLGLRRADAYSRRAPYLTKVVLPEGVLDLRTNKPAAEIETVALTAMLAVREDIHPAVTDLLMMAANDVFDDHTILADAGEFPSPKNIDLPLSAEAKRFYERGPPFLMRYLPFWAATLVDRMWVLLLPLIGLLVPLFKLMPPLYHWRIRRKLLQRYAELRQIDPQYNPVESEDDRNARLLRILELDTETVDVAVPRDYSDDIYKLRRDIDLVRRKLGEVAIQADD